MLLHSNPDARHAPKRTKGSTNFHRPGIPIAHDLRRCRQPPRKAAAKGCAGKNCARTCPHLLIFLSHHSCQSKNWLRISSLMDTAIAVSATLLAARFPASPSSQIFLCLLHYHHPGPSEERKHTRYRVHMQNLGEVLHIRQRTFDLPYHLSSPSFSCCMFLSADTAGPLMAQLMSRNI